MQCNTILCDGRVKSGKFDGMSIQAHTEPMRDAAKKRRAYVARQRAETALAIIGALFGCVAFFGGLLMCKGLFPYPYVFPDLNCDSKDLMRRSAFTWATAGTLRQLYCQSLSAPLDGGFVVCDAREQMPIITSRQSPSRSPRFPLTRFYFAAAISQPPLRVNF